ncbi:MAG: hypothetical protein ACO3RT_04505 [Arenicellales bacterium]|jgi:hypothetical protein
MKHYCIKATSPRQTPNGSTANVLIHVPRTGGTYFNNCLRANQVTTLDHVERFVTSAGEPATPALSAKGIGNPAWLSGHLRLSTLAAAFPPAKGHRYFVLLRNPVRQLISQVNWQAQSLLASRLSLARMSNYPFRLLVRVCQEGSAQPSQLPALLNRYFGYFLNNQSRSLSLLTGGRQAATDLNAFSARAFDALSALDGFSLESGLDAFIDALLQFEKGVGHQRVLLPRSARNAAAPFLDPHLTEEFSFFQKMIELQLPDFVLYLNARHLLEGGTSALYWPDENALLDICMSLSKRDAPATSDPSAKTRQRVAAKVAGLVTLGHTLNPRRYRLLVSVVACLGRRMPQPLRQFIIGRRSVFRKLSALHALASLPDA